MRIDDPHRNCYNMVMVDIIILTADSEELTKKQMAAIEYLRRQFAPHENYEFKRFEIVGDEDYKKVFLLLETGLIGDEGTMASVFARARYHFSIGVRGGLESHDGKRFQRNFTRDSDYYERNKRVAALDKEAQ